MSHDPLDPIAAMLRGWWIVVAAMAGCAVLVAVATAAQAPRWTSTAVLQYRLGDPTAALTGGGGGGVSGTDADRLLNSQVQVVLGDGVVEPVAQSLGVDARVVRRQVTVKRDQTSDLLMLSVTSGAPDASAAIATALTDSYVAAGKREGSDALLAQAGALDGSIAALNARIAAVPQGTEDEAAADPALTAYAAQVATLTQQQEQLRAAAALYPGKVTVLRAPVAPVAPSSPGPVTGGAVGAALGTVVGVFAAVALDVGRRRRLRRAYQAPAHSRPPAVPSRVPHQMPVSLS